VAIIADADAAGAGIEIPARLKAAFPRTPQVLLLGVVATLGIFGATLLLIIPGVLLGLAWSVSPAVAAIEAGTVLSPLRRSAELTRGNRATLFGIQLLFGVVTIVLVFALRLSLGLPLLARDSAGPWVFTLILLPVLSTALAAIMAAIIGSAYLELRRSKEGHAAGGLAAVFD
jgi:hypothetical protein